LNNPATGVYVNRNAGTLKNVSVSGITIAGASNGAATVYGYSLGSNTANANLGTISARGITVASQPGQGKTYGADDPDAAKTAYTITAGSLVGGDTLGGNVGRVAGENVGNYSFTTGTVAVTDGNGGNNYAVTFDGAGNKFQIGAAALTGSIGNQTKIYGQNDPLLAGIAPSLTGLVNRTVSDINGNNTPINDSALTSNITGLTRAGGENVGTYSITTGVFSAPSSNYGAPAFTGSPTLDITKATLSASVTANATKVYGTNDPLLGTVSLTTPGLVNGVTVTDWTGATTTLNDTATLATLARAGGENVGSYAIGTGTLNLSAPGNYNASFSAAGRALDITKATSINASIIGTPAKLYGGSDPLPGGSSIALAGAINTSVTDWNGGVLAINDTSAAKLSGSAASLTRSAGENVGNYGYTGGTIVLGGSAAVNYAGANFVAAGTQLNISPAALTITANNATRSFGLANPAFSAGYSGFVFGETPVVLTGTISFATPATVLSPPGAYVVVPAGQSSANYTIAYVNGTLSVTAPGPGFSAGAVAPVPAQGAALQTLGVKNYPELWSDCVAGSKAGGGGGFAGGLQLGCGGGGPVSVELPRATGR